MVSSARLLLTSMVAGRWLAMTLIGTSETAPARDRLAVRVRVLDMCRDASLMGTTGPRMVIPRVAGHKVTEKLARSAARGQETLGMSRREAEVA